MIGQQLIERKLSALAGAEVTFDQLKVSLLAGSIEAVGIKVGDLLTAARGVAKIAVTRALKGEIIVQSLTIERPVLNVRHLHHSSKTSRASAPDRIQNDDDDNKTRWKFDVEKLLIVDGQIDISPKLRVEKLLLELKRAADGYAVTLLAESLAQLCGTGTISSAADLSQVMDAAAQATLELGDLARIRFNTPRLRSNQGHLELEGKITLAQLLALL